MGNHARALATIAPPVEARVAHIADLMSRDAWSRERADELATAWGLGLNTVLQSATEAGRLVRGVFDRGAARAKIDTLLADAEADAYAIPDRAERARHLRAHAELVAKLSGCAAPTRVALSRGIDEVPAGWTRDDDADADEREEH